MGWMGPNLANQGEITGFSSRSPRGDPPSPIRPMCSLIMSEHQACLERVHPVHRVLACPWSVENRTRLQDGSPSRMLQTRNYHRICNQCILRSLSLEDDHADKKSYAPEVNAC